MNAAQVERSRRSLSGRARSFSQAARAASGWSW